MLNEIREYRTVFGCSLCEIAWVSPAVKESIQIIWEMNKKVFCPRCSACGHHEEPSLRLTPEVLRIEEVGNEFTIIQQF